MLALLVAVLAFGLLAGLGVPGWLDRALFDLRSQLVTRPASGAIVVVGIDPESLARIDVWPWPRRLLAAVIRRLHDAGVARLAIDIDVSSASDPEDDRLLGEALALFGPERVALPTFHQEAGSAEGGTALLVSRPTPHLAAVARETSVAVLPDPDGIVRRFRADLPHGLMSAWLAGRRPAGGPVFHPDFTIDPATFPYLPVADVLFGTAPADMLRGRLVLLGATDLALGDRAAVPRYRVLPGVVLQALVAESLLQDRAPAPLDPGAGPALVLLCGLLAVWVRLPPSAAAAIGLLIPAGIESGATALHLAGLLVPATGSVHLAALLAFALGLPLRIRLLETLFDAAATSLRRERALRARLLEIAPDPVFAIDARGRVVEANPAARALLAGVDGPDRLFAPDLFATLGRLATAGGEQRFECTIVRADGARATYDATAVASPGETGPLTVVQLRDVTERNAFLERLRYLARHDPVTGLPDRRALLQDLREAPPGAGGETLVVLGIDGFADLAASFDPVVLDDMLARLADLVRAALLPGEAAWRMADDRFVLRLAEGEAGAVRSRLASLCERAAELVAPGASGLRPLLRAGVARAGNGAPAAAELLGRAHQAFVDACRRRERIRFHDPARDGSAGRPGLGQALARALADGRLDLLFQPQIAIGDGSLVGCEALVRWHDPELGPVPPERFVPEAEQTGLVDRLTTLVLERALAAREAWLRAGHDVPVSLNLSAASLARPAFVRDLAARAVRSAGRGAVTFEITETAVIEDRSRARELLADVRAAGVRIAIDDFGTGHSSFAHLGSLPVDELKLDRAFVRDLPQNRVARSIVASLVDLAGRIGVSVVVEGVETEQQLRFLRGLGRPLAVQGYAVGRPCPAADIPAFAGGDPAIRGLAAAAGPHHLGSGTALPMPAPP